MDITDFFANIDKNAKFLYGVVSIAILFFLTTVVKIELGHLLAFIVVVIVIVSITAYNNERVDDFNKETEYKLKSLVDKAPEYFHLDADMINLFFNIKQDLSEYNEDAYTKAIETADNLLRIRSDFEKKLCKPPVPPNLLKNFGYESSEEDFLNTSNYTFKDDKKCDSILINAYENYQVAEAQLKKCMNYLHSLIISLPGVPVIHRKHEKIMDRAHILLKRNLDIIKNIYDKNLTITSDTKFISDYDLPKAINKHSGFSDWDNNKAISNFNFY